MTDADRAASELIRVAGEFVTHVLFPRIDAGEFATRLDWRERASQTFQATILPWRGTRYRITVHTGVPDQVLRRLQEVDMDDGLTRAAERVGGVEPAMILAWFAGVALFAAHEACHATAGHVAYQRQTFPQAWSGSLGFREASSETPPPGAGARVASNYATFLRLAELEADGAAVALLLEAGAELLRLVDGIAVEEGGMHASRCFVLLGVFATLELLSPEGTASDLYPAPETRYLNVVAAVFRRTAPGLFEPSAGDYLRRPATDAEAEDAISTFAETVFPTILALGRVPIGSAFWEDIATILGGDRPLQSEAGRTLSRLTDDRSKFMRSLIEFRETDMWSDFDG